MSSGQPLKDLNTYWETLNATRKKCRKSGKTYESPDSIKRVECIVNTLNSIAKNNTPNLHLIATKQYRRRVLPLAGKNRNNALAAAAAAAAAANNQNNNDDDDDANGNNNDDDANGNNNDDDEAEEDNVAAPLRASAAPPPQQWAPPPLPAASRAPRPSRAVTAAAAAAAALAKFKLENPPKKINDIFNGSTLNTVNDLIKEKCFNNNTSEFNKANITLDPMPTGSLNKPTYTILFNNNKIHNGNTYILKQDNTTFSIQEISRTSQVTTKGGRRRKTQKKNKNKKRTTSKRR